MTRRVLLVITVVPELNEHEFCSSEIKKKQTFSNAYYTKYVLYAL